MIRSKHARKSITLGLALTLVTVTGAFAAPPVDTVAEVYITPTKVVFEIVVEHDGLILSYVDPCGAVVEQYLDRGETPVIYNTDASGKLLDDGVYNWRLEARPIVDPQIAEILKDARKNNDQQIIYELKREGLLPVGIAQGGYLTIDKGLFIEDQQEEGAQAPNDKSPNKDFVILDDLIVDGSACIGFDCVNGESFGFDTIRLKENNLRIKFDDTSVAASFPRNDWQLTANDSANGGASKFSIDDISGSRTPFTVEAGARSHSLYVDDGGRVGLGTSTPVVELHVVSGDTPTLRLEQSTSSGFAPQTWDLAGNETSFFIRDATNGSTLPFRIRPGADSNVLTIDTDSQVGIGTLTSDALLHVKDSTDAKVLVENTTGTAATRSLFELKNAGATQFTINNTAAAVVWRMANNGDFTLSADGTGALEFELASTGDLEIRGSLTEMSDVNSKENFSQIDPHEVLSRVNALPITTWNYKDNPATTRHMGPMAQDFFATFGLGGTETGIAPRNMAAVALASIQGLSQEVEAKDARIQTLEAQNAALAARLAALEALVQSLADGR